MKKFTIMIFAIIFTVICLPVNFAYAENEFSYSGNFDMDSFLETFSEDYYDRTTKNYENEKNAALFIAGYFADFGLKTKDFSLAEQNEDYLQEFSYGTGNSNNVIGVLPATTETKQNVIIGAHYDNVYDFETTNPYTRVNYNTQSHGAYDNGSGIAVMMSVADRLKQNPLPFNVTFVAFGAEELGMYGSKYYAENLTKSQKENTLLMINLDSISAGDYVYLYCKDWQTEHDSYLRERATELSIPLRALPFDKKYINDPFGNNYYSHLAYFSDNYYFMQENINTAFFMSMNWESKTKAGVVESNSNNDIMHTYNDTYAKLKEYYPATYLLYMQYISELISYSLQKEDFAGAMILSQNNTPKYSFIMNEKYLTVAAFLIWIGLAVFVYFYYGKLKKISDKSVKEYMSDPENIKKMNTILKGFQNMPPFNNMNYPPNTYRPKKGDSKFTVFGEEYENKKEKQDENKENKKD